jgi:hypothetical protein
MYDVELMKIRKVVPALVKITDFVMASNEAAAQAFCIALAEFSLCDTG